MTLEVDGVVDQTRALILGTLNSLLEFYDPIQRLNTSSLLFLSKTESESESGSHKNVRVRGKPPGSSDGKTRVRTVLNEKQLHTLR